jgi:hypothetical protein
VLSYSCCPHRSLSAPCGSALVLLVRLMLVRSVLRCMMRAVSLRLVEAATARRLSSSLVTALASQLTHRSYLLLTLLALHRFLLYLLFIASYCSDLTTDPPVLLASSAASLWSYRTPNHWDTASLVLLSTYITTGLPAIGLMELPIIGILPHWSPAA